MKLGIAMNTGNWRETGMAFALGYMRGIMARERQ